MVESQLYLIQLQFIIVIAFTITFTIMLGKIISVEYKKLDIDHTI